MEPLLKACCVSYSYHSPEGATPALFQVSFTVDPGEFLAIVGPSGCGKSTLLSLLSGLLEPEEGAIYIEDTPLKEASTGIGYMLQRDHLFEWRTIRENAALGLEIQHQKTREAMQELDEMLRNYGLAAFASARPSELSGGMRQRAALIRTLVLEPDILLLDEPFSALDYQTRLEVSDDIFRIIKEQEKTALLVTHDISEAIAMGEQVIVLSSRPAGIKNVFDIHLSVDKRTPFSSRTAPEFSAYFHQIWKELS